MSEESRPGIVDVKRVKRARRSRGLEKGDAADLEGGLETSDMVRYAPILRSRAFSRIWVQEEKLIGPYSDPPARLLAVPTI